MRLSEDLPLVIGMVDEEAKVEALVEALHPMLGRALVTLDAVRVVRYGHDAGLE